MALARSARAGKAALLLITWKTNAATQQKRRGRRRQFLANRTRHLAALAPNPLCSG
jgi:hypothetical protein